MPKQTKYSWETSKLVDDVGCEEKDAEIFESLLSGQGSPEESERLLATPGKVLRGRIVEITKDHVVVDVGLKSEGLVAISEFSDPSQLYLDNEIDVFLDQTEDNHGQIGLSREKAEKMRHWEEILEHYQEGSIVRGKVMRKVKGGLMVEIGVEAFLPGSQIDNTRIKNLDEYIDKTFDFKILKINIDR